MVATFHHYAFNPTRAPEFSAGTKVAAAEMSRRQIGESFGDQCVSGYPWGSLEAKETASPRIRRVSVPTRYPAGEQSLEVEEARSGAFMAICEVGKAPHRGQPADPLWAAAVGATERWMSLTK